MHALRCALVGIVLAFTGYAGEIVAQPAHDGFDHAGLARRSLEHHIRPGYMRLAVETRELQSVLESHCTGPSRESRARLEQAFDLVVIAFGRIEHLNFGPVTEFDRLERMLLWPDRRGIGSRQIAKALETRDASVTDPDQLAKRSVAMHGLPALDVLLFPATSELGGKVEAGQHRCLFALAVATNFARVARRLEEEWAGLSGFAAKWLLPGPDNRSYLDAKETTQVLAKAFDYGIEKLRDMRIGGPFGFNPQRRKIPAVLARSGRAMLLAKSNIEGLRSLFVDGGLQAAILSSRVGVHSPEATSLTEQVIKELDVAAGLASNLWVGRVAVDNPETARAFLPLGFPLKNAATIARQVLTSSANLPQGFNATDGD